MSWLSLFAVRLILVCSQVAAEYTVCRRNPQRGEHHSDDHCVSLVQASLQLTHRRVLGTINGTKMLGSTAAQTVAHRLWHGEDLSEEEHKTIFPRYNYSNHKAGTLTKPYKIVGMFGSGTNLMRTFLEANFGEPAESFGTCYDKSGDTRSQLPCPDFWKHTHPYRIEYFDESPSSLRAAVVIAMVRNPISQLASWKRTPFNLRGCSVEAGECTCDDGDTDEVSLGYFPCGANTSDKLAVNFGSPSAKSSKAKGAPYASFMSVWNSYTTGYEFLAHADIPVKVIVVHFEDLVENPESVLERLSKELGAERPTEPVKIISYNARPFDRDKSKDRFAALHAIKTKSYRQAFSEADIRKMCKEFDTELLLELDYLDECQ